MHAFWCRSLSQSRQTAPAAASIAENEEQPEPATASTAGATSDAADDQQPPDAAAESSASSKSETTGMVNAKQQALNRSLSSATAAFAFGAGSTVSGPNLLRSVTGVSAAVKPFAFGSTAAPGLAASGTTQILGTGQAAAAASAGFAAGQLFGFAAPATARSVPSFGTGAFGGLGSGFSFGSGNSPAPSSLQAAGMAVAAAAAVAAVKIGEQDPGNDAACTHEVDSVDGTDEEGAGDEAEDADTAEADKADEEDDHEDDHDHADKAEADEDDSHFALPDDLLSDDDEEAPAEASIAGSANVSNAEVDATHEGDGSANGDEEEESEADADDESSGALSCFPVVGKPLFTSHCKRCTLEQTQSDVCWLLSLQCNDSGVASSSILDLLALMSNPYTACAK